VGGVARNTQGISEHVAYEIELLFATHGLLVVGDALAGRIHDAVLESFAIHVRNLIEFFFDPPNPRHPDDARAEHFFADPATWHSLVGAKPTNFTEAQRKAHKQVSHLTYTRVDLTAEERRWYVGNLARDLHDVVWKFLDNAEDARVGESLRSLKGRLRR
jgi:hypothetical protein